MTGADGDRSDDDRPTTTLFESLPDPVLACERTSDPDGDGRVVRDVIPPSRRRSPSSETASSGPRWTTWR
ncbi:hypothetical protein [Halogeometricum sp. CBA1124]|uniref:hypothetical protein n=1 Tax=Halogeometricum sp. CBA1124 TaxID=2668071 RepID=UPI00142C92DC|nr:hypothetical protein [Halogeometricum sp. CBA1124]MUV58559.1 hypothetical protein [Halogeometricum sp. CBA1124]